MGLVAKVNKDLLRLVRKRIEINPSKFDWTYFFWDKDSESSPFDPIESPTNAQVCKIMEETCGTTMCIAGWAIALACPAGSTIREFMRKELKTVIDGVAALKLLFPEYDPDSNDADIIKNFLFLPWEFRDAAGRKYTSRNTPELAREEALRRIDWLLDDKDISQYIMPSHIRDKNCVIEPI